MVVAALDLMSARTLQRLLAAALLWAAISCPAQDSAHGLRWADGAPNAVALVKDGATIEGLKGTAAHVYVSLTELKDTEYNRVWVEISNYGKTVVDFDPLSAILVNDEKGKILRAEIPDKAARSILKLGEAKSQELSGAHCNYLAAVQCSPTDSQFRMSKQILTFSAEQAHSVRDNALNGRTLGPGKQVQGAILFKKDKRKAGYILKIVVGAEAFEFPVTAENKPPSYY